VRGADGRKIPMSAHTNSSGRVATKGISHMVKMSVMYVGQPINPAAFDAYYWNTHLPTVRKWPAIRRIVVAKGAPGDELYQVADLWFDSRADLDVALASPERKVSADDIKNFPEFRGQIKRQIFEVKPYWP
jgi:uncharacterized protein (TIGR02118 family)